MDAGFTLNKRIHARGGRGRKKDAEAKQKRADYVAWRDQQDAFRRNRPDDDHDDAAHGDAVSLTQIVAHPGICCSPTAQRCPVMSLRLHHGPAEMVAVAMSAN